MSDETKETLFTPEFRVSFPDVFKATSVNNSEPKFRLSMLFAPGADLSELRALASRVAVARWGADKVKEMVAAGKFKSPFLDGANDKYELPPGTILVRATTLFQPGIVDEQNQPILRPEEFYGGCYAWARVHAFTHHHAQSKPGVSIGFDVVQKLRDGKPFQNRPDASKVFKPVAGSAAAPAAAAGDPLL
jgi:hypothetical protein